MEPEHIIDETATIQGADIDEVYESCLEWVKSIRADVCEKNKPSFIKAEHRLYTVFPFGIYPNPHIDWIILNIHLTQEKKILHEIFQDYPDVKVEVKIPNIQHNTKRRLPRYVRWYQVVEEFWNYLGIDLDDEVLRRYYPQRHLEITLNVMRNIFAFSILFIIILDIALFYIYMTNQMNELTLLTSLVLPVAGLYYVLKPNMKVARDIMKRLRELYPSK